MVWIEVSLAFAVLMVLLSTMVSAFVEVLGRIWKWRQKGLEQMVRHVYDDVLLPKLNISPASNGERADGFAAAVCKPHYQPNESWFGSKMPINALDSKRLSELSTAEFIERVAESPEGQQLWLQAKQRGVELGRHYLDLAVHDIAHKFDLIGNNAGEYFGRRARLTSVLAAIVFAFAINLDVIQVVKDLAASPELRQQLIQKMEAQEEGLQADQKVLGKAKQELATLADANEAAKKSAELAKPSADDAGNSEASTNIIAAQANKLKRVEAELDENEAAIEQGIDDIRAEIAELNKLGLELGWTKADVDWLLRRDDKPGCESDCLNWPLQLITWILVTLLGGVLVGLGGPFWFDVYRRLSVFSSVVQRLSAGKSSTPVKQPEAEKPVDYVELFERAAATVALHKAAPAPLLKPDGTVDYGDSQ